MRRPAIHWIRCSRVLLVLMALAALLAAPGRPHAQDQAAGPHHHGEPRKRFVGSQGALRMEVGRARRVFDELTLSARLSVGQMIVLGSLDSRPGSLGHHFFTQDSEGPVEQKLMVIRLSQTQHDDLFDAEGLLPLDRLDDE